MCMWDERLHSNKKLSEYLKNLDMSIKKKKKKTVVERYQYLLYKRVLFFPELL